MRRAVNVYRAGEAIVVESTSMLAGGGRVANGWTRVLSTSEVSPEAVGQAVRAGLEASGAMTPDELPALRGMKDSPASLALGFATEGAMQAAGVTSAAVGLQDSQWKVTPMRNEGPGRGFAGHADAPAMTHDGEWSAADLGAATLEALAAFPTHP